MFTVILEKNILFYLMAAAGVVGIISKLVSCMTIRRLTRAAENMPKSDHRLMKLIRAKYEHASMVSDKVQNVDAFVDKYLFEYKVWGLRMHTWRELEKQMIWISGLVAAVGFIGSYNLTGMQGKVLYYSAGGIMEMAVLYLLYQWGDEAHSWNVIHTYIVDFLENVCAHKMARVYRGSAQAKEDVSPERAVRDKAQDTEPEDMYRHSEEYRTSSEKARGRSRKVLRGDGREPELEAGYDSERRNEREPVRESMSRSEREPVRESVRRDGREPVRESMSRSEREPVRESVRRDGRESMRGSEREPVRESMRRDGREPVRETMRGDGRGNEREPIVESELGQIHEIGRGAADEISTEGSVDEPAMAIQLEEARRSMEKDAEERKVMIREILEQYLA